jgi:uncharacterized protein (DUF952 family)
MILSTFYNENKTANVCKIAGQYEVMLYIDKQFLKSQVVWNEQDGEDFAEDWVLNANII